MTILTKAQAAATGENAPSGPDLLETYNHLTGGAVQRFASITAGQRRVEMAFLAAEDADAHTGVPKDSAPVPRGRKAIRDKAAAKSVKMPESLEATNPVIDEQPAFPPGSMADQLDKAARNAKPITPRPKAESAAGAIPKQAIFAVQATFAGTSTPQAGSIRNNVLLRIQGAKNSAATVEDLDKHFEVNTRGFVQKLLEKQHLVILTEDAYKKAKPTKPPASKKAG